MSAGQDQQLCRSLEVCHLPYNWICFNRYSNDLIPVDIPTLFVFVSNILGCTHKEKVFKFGETRPDAKPCETW